MRLSLVIFLGLISLSGHSQIQFENGYIITNEGKRINCLIRNLDWKNNPKAIEYVLAEGEEVKQATIERITEFGIVDGNTFRRFVVKMDRSSDFLTSLSTERNPSFAEETLFLKVLIQGKATLFQYEEDGLLRFFYSVDQQPVSQLVFKRYHTPDDQVVRNEMYKQQLVNELSCGQLNEDALKVKYSPSDLERYFSAFNACHGSDSNRLNKVMKPDLFNLNIRPGLAYNSMTLTGYAVIVDADFGKQPTYRLGVELEFVMPFNKNKWAIILEPAYQHHEAKMKYGSVPMTVNYSSIEINAGVRHYFFLSPNSKIFLNAVFTFDIPINSIITFSNRSFEFSSGLYPALGAGYQWRKLNAEIRYMTSRDPLAPHANWTTEFSGAPMLIIGYQLF